MIRRVRQPQRFSLHGPLAGVGYHTYALEGRHAEAPVRDLLNERSLHVAAVPVLVLVALDHAGVGLENDAQRVGFGVIGGFHGSTLQYFATLLVTYTVTTAVGLRSTSTNIRIR